MASEEDIIRKRLLVDGDGVSNDDRRLNTLIKTAVKWCTDQPDSNNDEETYQKMLFTLEQCDFSFQKSQLIVNMTQSEMDSYKSLNADIERSIQLCQADILSARQDLKAAREVRRNRQQYDGLARVITKLPPRARSQETIDHLRRKRAGLETSRKRLIAKLDTRKRQFHLLVHSIHELQALLEQEDKEGESPSSLFQPLSPSNMDMS